MFDLKMSGKSPRTLKSWNKICRYFLKKEKNQGWWWGRKKGRKIQKFVNINVSWLSWAFTNSQCYRSVNLRMTENFHFFFHFPRQEAFVNSVRKKPPIHTPKKDILCLPTFSFLFFIYLFIFTLTTIFSFNQSLGKFKR